MSKIALSVSVLLAVVVLIVIALVASQVGGSRIRTSHQIQIGRLLLRSNRVLPGSPVNITYDMINLAGINDASMIMLRTPAENIVLGQISSDVLAQGRFTVQVPCDSNIYQQTKRNNARFVLVSANQGVLAQSQSFSLLPPGPDCIYQ